MKTIILSEVKKVQGLMMAVFITLLMALFTPAVYPQAVHKPSDFNHMKTGFPLTGAHIKLECETCHVGGLFKGTPTDCAGCHSVGRRVVAPFKSANHMPTTAACNICHTNTITFLGARFNHIGVQPKACVTCHNGRTTVGKPTGHIQTTASCDSCHRTSAWVPAGFDHAAPLPSCVTCHTPGGPGRAKPANHVFVPAGVSCDSCHKSGFTTFLGATFDHVGANVTAGTCATCHLTGQSGAKTKPSGHIPTASISCDTCHATTGYINFVGPMMSHVAVEAAPIQCSTCHNGSYVSQKSILLSTGALGKTTTHMATGTTECGSCHLGRTSFLGANFTHQTGTAVLGKCDTCHVPGGPGRIKPVTHISTTLQCDSSGCHSPTNYVSFAGIAFNHTGAVPGTCGTCHLGQSAAAKTKPPTHIPTTGNACDACHGTPSGNGPPGGFVTPAPTRARIHAASVPAIACVMCHNGSYTNAQAKPSTHVATNAACNTCHLDTTYTSFAGAKFNHASVTTLGICGTCHKTGGGATPKPAGTSHIPTTGDACDACHSYTAGTFAVRTMNHANVITTPCKTCHSAAYKPIGVTDLPLGFAHIPYPTTTVDCGTCHLNKISFTNSTMNHGVVAATTCATCHSPTYSPIMVVGLSSGHIPIKTINCSGCHLSTSSFANPAMNHAVVTDPCDTCHVSTYASQGKRLGGAKPKPSNHILTSLACNICHIGTSSWSHPPEVMQHAANNITSNCKTCHDTTIARTTLLPTSSMQQRSLGSHEGSKTNQDCISCHALQFTRWNKP